MIIRGIDFARHNVVVGTDAESTTTPRAGQPGLPARGDVLARVLSVSGSEAMLDINGLRVVVEAHVSLNAGDKLFVRVHEPQNGTLRLSIIGGGTDGEPGSTGLTDGDLDEMLRDLNQPVDDRTRMAARALVARDGSLGKQGLTTLLTTLKGLPLVSQKDANAAALLQKSDTPVSPSTVAVVNARANPGAAPQLAARLAPLTPALEALVKQLPARSPLALQAQNILSALKGLPLGPDATPQAVARALGEWLDKLQPKVVVDATFSARTAIADAKAASTANPANIINQAETMADGAAPGAAKPALARLDGVPASQPDPSAAGINKTERAAIGADLASLLDRLGKDVATATGPANKTAVLQVLHEAVAELRYTQLANGPTPAGPTGQEFMVPLLTPQLSQERPESQLQVYQRAAKPGEPVDPNNVRFVFVLNTEHMSTVQAELTIKEGKVDLSIGLPVPADKDFVSDHIDQLKDAIASLGWPVGRFAARQARALPPKMRQSEGLTDVVRFDRRV